MFKRIKRLLLALQILALAIHIDDLTRLLRGTLDAEDRRRVAHRRRSARLELKRLQARHDGLLPIGQRPLRPA